MANGGAYLRARWLWLRALGLIFFSAFYSFAFQIHGLIGERGILPAREYLSLLSQYYGFARKLWLVPSLFWIDASDAALTASFAVGLIASALIVLNVRPRLMIGICTLLFLSCVAVLQDFSSYQSDGMLLEAGFISLFVAPRGTRPRLGETDPPSNLSLFMLRWEWLRIYFESGIVKLASGDPHWRNFTAMDDYYQNGPLPSWPGWYVQQLPHWYHALTVVIIFAVELFVVWAVFLPRKFRIACFIVVTMLQTGIIATANYAFLNYLVLALGVLLLDDDVFAKRRFSVPAVIPRTSTRWTSIRQRAENAILGIVLYATIAAFVFPGVPLFNLPAIALDPFRIANAYGLFAVMTPARYEIEFQGSNDGEHWVAYPFKYKPQDVNEHPGFFAPYQPRFDWNLWFASLGPPSESPWVMRAANRLVEGSPQVLSLFRDDPFHGKPPRLVRTVISQYWFTDVATKRRTGAWWRRKDLREFMPVATR